MSKRLIVALLLALAILCSPVLVAATDNQGSMNTSSSSSVMASGGSMSLGFGPSYAAGGAQDTSSAYASVSTTNKVQSSYTNAVTSGVAGGSAFRGVTTQGYAGGASATAKTGKK